MFDNIGMAANFINRREFRHVVFGRVALPRHLPEITSSKLNMRKRERSVAGGRSASEEIGNRRPRDGGAFFVMRPPGCRLPSRTCRFFSVNLSTFFRTVLQYSGLVFRDCGGV